MVHWPKSTVGRVMTIVIALIVGLGLVQSAIALSGTFVWITLAVAVVLPQWNHRKDLEAARLAGTAVTQPSTEKGALEQV